MSVGDVDKPAVTVRLSRGKAIAGSVAFFLLLAGFGLHDHLQDPASKLWALYIAVGTAMILAALVSARDRAPRLVIDPVGLHWRSQADEPLVFIAWADIASADITPGSEDHPRSLRLRPPPYAVVEQVSSDRRAARTIDVPIDGLDISDRLLMAAIHGRAPHLFTRMDRNRGSA
jgi:hypothetical protein